MTFVGTPEMESTRPLFFKKRNELADRFLGPESKIMRKFNIFRYIHMLYIKCTTSALKVKLMVQWQKST